MSQPQVPQTGTRVSQKAQRLWGSPRERSAVDCGELARGDTREETVVGNACGGKPVPLSHEQGWRHPRSLSLHTPALAAEQRGWPIKRPRPQQQRRTPNGGALLVPYAQTTRGGPQSAGPLYVPDTRSNRGPGRGAV